jgi:hypothetical protein
VLRKCLNLREIRSGPDYHTSGRNCVIYVLLKIVFIYIYMYIHIHIHIHIYIYMCVCVCVCIYIYISGSRDSVVGIATRYGLEGPGIESRWGEIFRT